MNFRRGLRRLFLVLAICYYVIGGAVIGCLCSLESRRLDRPWLSPRSSISSWRLVEVGEYELGLADRGLVATAVPEYGSLDFEPLGDDWHDVFDQESHSIGP